MPFQSEKQRRYLWANEPEIARDWTDTYGSGIAKALGGRIPFAEAGSTGKTSIPEWNLAILKTALETATSDEERAEIQADIDRVQGDIGTGADTLLGSGEAPTEGFWGKLSEMLGMSQAEGAEPTEEERAAIERTGGVEDVRDPLVYDEEKGYDVRDLQAHGLAGIYPHAWDNKPTLEGDPFYKDGEFQTFKQPTRNWDPADYPFKGPVQSGYETLGYNESGNPLQDFRGNVRSTSGVRQLYKTPRTIADQNRVLGRTFTEDQGGIVDWLMNQGSNLRSNISQAYNVGKEKYVMPTLGVMGAVANYLNPLNPQSRNYNPELQGQVDALNARNMLGNQSSPYKITSGPLAGKNLISGFGTNDYDEMLAKKISWFEKRKAEKKSISDKAYQKTIQEQQRREAEKRQAATAAAAAAQVRSNIQRYGTGDRPNTGMNRPGGGRGQSPTGGDVQGTPFNTGGLAALWPR